MLQFGQRNRIGDGEQDGVGGQRFAEVFEFLPELSRFLRRRFDGSFELLLFLGVGLRLLVKTDGGLVGGLQFRAQFFFQLLILGDELQLALDFGERVFGFRGAALAG